VAAIFRAGCSSNPVDLYRRESAGDLATKITLMRRRSAGGFEQDETRGHADAAADENHAEDDPGHQLRRGDGPRGGVRRRGC